MAKNYFQLLSHKTFKKYRDRINQENKTGVQLILLFDAVILLINLIGAVLEGKNMLQLFQLDALSIYIVVAGLLYFLVRRKKEANYTFWIYMLEEPLLLITMADGIFKHPYELTFSFMVYLVLFPLLILDVPWRIDLFVLGNALIYVGFDHHFKSLAVFSRDMTHLSNIVLMIYAASIFFLGVRMRNIQYADYFSHKADEDPLTGLYNRSGARHQINTQLPGILIYLDLDHFKEINDAYGHKAGDAILVEVAEVLRKNLRKEDVIVRLGGDEFAVYAHGIWTEEDISFKLRELIDYIKEIKVADHEDCKIVLSASIGCAYAPNGCESLEKLVHVADTAMYQAKRNGRDGFKIVMI